MKKLLFLLLFVFLAFYSYPSRLDGKVKGEFHHLSIEDGLSQNTVHCIHQDSRGFMWFGTRVGLNRHELNCHPDGLLTPGNILGGWKGFEKQLATG